MYQDRSRLEYAQRCTTTVVDKSGNLGIWVCVNKSRAELIAFTNIDQPRVVFGTRVASGQQLFEHHSDLDPIGRGQ